MHDTLQRLRGDDRALTMSFVKLLASLGVGAAIIYAVYRATDPLLADAREAAPGGMGGMAANQWFETGLDILPGIFLFCAFFGFLVIAVYERGEAG